MAQRAIITTYKSQSPLEAGQIVRFISDGVVSVINNQAQIPFGIALSTVAVGSNVAIVHFGTGYCVTTHFGDSVQFAQPGDPVYSRGDGWVTMAPTAGSWWKVGMASQLPGEAWFERGQKLRMIISAPMLEVIA